MTIARILQIVPVLPPASEGVTATAEALANALEERGAARSEFLALGHAAPSPVQSKNSQAIEQAIAEHQPNTLLVHYVNYAYDPHGCPEALVDAVTRWSVTHGGRVIAYFHEVYASGPPWRRTFWVSRRQQRLALRLAEASGFCLTSLDIYAERLRALGYRGDLLTRAIPSTIGEPQSLLTYDERAPELAIFGSAGRRARAYRDTEGALRHACERLAIGSIIDIGPGSVAPPSVAGRAVERRGALPAVDVSARLRAAAAGFVAYPLDFLGKSSIFAAYTSHGMLAIATGRRPGRSTSLRSGMEYWNPNDAPLEPGREAAVAAAGRAWYAGHDIAALAAEIAGRLGTA